MDLFERTRDFFHRRAANRLTMALPGVQLHTQRCEALQGNFVFPGQDCSAWIEHEGLRIGHVDYGLNPLGDRVYINMIRIAPGHTKNGLGMGTLWCLWNLHQVPLVPIHESGSSIGFWSKARRRLGAAGAVVGPELRVSEMAEEQQRWQHLVPEPEHKRLIRELQASPDWPALRAEMKARSDYE